MKTHNMTHDRLYRVYVAMKSRCYYKKHKHYYNYGGRGIKVCEEWMIPENFFKWALENGYDPELPPKECTLDRIDVNGDYCPENCRWISRREQSNNRRNTIFINYKGQKLPIAEVAELVNIPHITIYKRLKRGCSDEEALLPPSKVGMHQKMSEEKT